jgi:hypothetical protein
MEVDQCETFSRISPLLWDSISRLNSSVGVIPLDLISQVAVLKFSAICIQLFYCTTGLRPDRNTNNISIELNCIHTFNRVILYFFLRTFTDSDCQRTGTAEVWQGTSNKLHYRIWGIMKCFFLMRKEEKKIWKKFISHRIISSINSICHFKRRTVENRSTSYCLLWKHTLFTEHFQLYQVYNTIL